MSVWKFIKSIHFWKHLGLIILSFGVLLWLTLQFLNLYTFHGQSIEVPDFTGYTVQEVENMEESKHYRFEVVDSVYDNTKIPGSIVSQLPLPGSNVKKGRQVYITIIALLPEKTTLPNLIDFSERQAIALLETHGLKVGRLEYVPDIGQTVLRAKYNGKVIPWGTEINKGEKIDLVIGRGRGDADTYIPNVMGELRRDAIRKINDAGLNVGAEIFAHPDDTVNVYVTRQNPPYREDAEIGLGETIDLWYE
ncbi:MAG: penicillin-binding protein [Marinilabiliales bacterium]|nr:MAG: penicillin-binding protein [Marinilabiliales bacterium]